MLILVTGTPRSWQESMAARISAQDQLIDPSNGNIEILLHGQPDVILLVEDGVHQLPPDTRALVERLAADKLAPLVVASSSPTPSTLPAIETMGWPVSVDEAYGVLCSAVIAWRMRRSAHPSQTSATGLETVVHLLRAAECRDPETGDHLVRMALYSRTIADELGLSAAESDFVFRAAPLHDIGKIGIVDGILHKPDVLSAEERHILERHAVIGYNILQGNPHPLIATAADIALCHHERVNGRGYPSGRAGEDIPLSARIVTVADVFDALMSARPYKRPWSLADATTYIIDRAGEDFDSECVKAFLSAQPRIHEIMRRYSDNPFSVTQAIAILTDPRLSAVDEFWREQPEAPQPTTAETAG